TIDAVRIPDMIMRAIVTVPKAKSSDSRAGDPFGGNIPVSRSATGIGPMKIAASEVRIAARFLPKRRDRAGAITTASAVETKYPSTRIEIWLDVSSQKYVLM